MLNSSTSASQKQHHSGWSLIKLPPRRHPSCSPVHSIGQEHVSRRRRESPRRPPGCTPYAAPPASECWRQAAETMARWPLDDPGPVKARLLDGCVTRHRPRAAGALAEEPLGKPEFASCCSLLAARGGLPGPKRRTTSRPTCGNGQSGVIWPGFSRDAGQQTANDWPSAHGAGWTMRHGWAPMLGRPWTPSWVFSGHGAMRGAKQRLGRRRGASSSQRLSSMVDGGWWRFQTRARSNRRLALIGRGEKRMERNLCVRRPL